MDCKTAWLGVHQVHPVIPRYIVHERALYFQVNFYFPCSRTPFLEQNYRRSSRTVSMPRGYSFELIPALPVFCFVYVLIKYYFYFPD